MRMAFSISGLLRTLAFAAALFSGLASPSWAQSKGADSGLRLSYDVYTGGLHVIVLDIDMLHGANDYTVTVTAETRGFIGWMFPWRSSILSEGALESARTLPVLHRTDSLFRGRKRIVELTYGKDGVATRIEPPHDDDERDRVSDDMRRNTFDPVSGIFAAIVAIGDGGSCNRTVPVFDGRRRYDFIIGVGGDEKLPASSYSFFAGNAVRCSFNMERRAGFWRQDRAGEVRTLEDGQVWLAPVAGSKLPIPVRAMAKSPFGAAVMHLREARAIPPGGLPPDEAATKKPSPQGAELAPEIVRPASPVGPNG